MLLTQQHPLRSSIQSCEHRKRGRYTKMVTTPIVAVLLMLATSSLAFPRDTAQRLINSQLRTLHDTRQVLKYIREVIDNMDNNIEAMQKRSVCNIGGGMGHNCEYDEALSSAHDSRHMLWGDNPGKRSNAGAVGSPFA